MIFLTSNWSTKVSLDFVVRFWAILYRLPFRKGCWNDGFYILTDLSAGFALCRLIEDFPMHLGPKSKCIMTQGSHDPTAWVGKMQGFENRIFYWVCYGHTIVHTDTFRANVQIAVWQEVGVDLLTFLFIVSEDAISHFFLACILAFEYCEKSLREQLSKIVLKELLLW